MPEHLAISTIKQLYPATYKLVQTHRGHYLLATKVPNANICLVIMVK